MEQGEIFMKKFVSFVLSICMILSVFGGIGTVSAAWAQKGQTADGTSAVSINVGAQDTNNATTLEKDVAGICGKGADDKIFKLTKTIGTGSEGRCTIEPYIGIGCEMGVRALMSFDVCFLSDETAFNVGYAAAKEGATSSAADQCNNVNSFFTMSVSGGFELGRMFTVADKTLPASFDKNRWYNIAIEVPNDETSTAYVYINGEKYTGYFHEGNNNTQEIKSYGVRHMRLNHLDGVLGIDNYYVNTAQQSEDMYDAKLYQTDDITFTENEKVSYDETEKQFRILDSSLTAGELKSFIDAKENQVAIYENAKSNVEIGDDKQLSAINSVVVYNQNGAFRYYDFLNENTSDFEIEVNSDFTSASVTGVKQGYSVPNKLVIPENIAGYTINKIADNAFANISGYKEVEIPGSVESIGENAFANSDLENFVVPNSVCEMKKGVVKNCFSLKTLRFSENEKFTAISDETLLSEYTDDENKLFGNMSIYIPKNIKTISADFLEDFKENSVVTIYGEYDSAARTFVQNMNEKIADGSLVNGFGKKISEVKFVEYDFANDKIVSYDETQINKGDEDVYVNTTKDDTVLQISQPGLGGKTQDDNIISLTASSGNNGTNYIYSGNNVWEMSIMAPKENSAVISLIYYYTEDKSNSYRQGEDICQVSSDGVYVRGEKVVSGQAGRWYTIGVVVPEVGKDVASVYINSVRHDAKLTKSFYGVNRFAFYKSGGLSTVYFDNFSRCDTYNAKKDAAPEVTSTSDEIKIYDDGIVYTDENKKYTAGELKAMIETNAYSRANIRIYTDSNFSTIVADDETIEKGAVLVAAATNGYSHERAYSYFPINPPINTTLYDIKVNDDQETATVTGWNTKNITPVDDLSIISIPEKIAGYTITAIADNAFRNNEEVESVTLPDTVEKIGAYAFSGRRADPVVYGKIKTIKWPKNLKYIGEQAFSCQTALEEVTLPYGVETVSTMAFYWNTALKKAVIPESVTSMGENVFRLCSLLEYVKLSGGVKTIPAYTFAGANNIKTLIIPAGVTADAGSAFNNYETVSPEIYGVSQTFAEEFATNHGYKFNNSIGGIITTATVMGDGNKEIIGSDYDINYGFKKFYLNATYANVSNDIINARAMIAAYDKDGKMLAVSEKNITLNRGETIEITNDDNLFVENLNLTDGAVIKAMLWRKENNEPLAISTDIVMDKTNKELHVLLIGNSYGNDSFGYINKIAESDNVTLKCYNLYIGGGALYAHHYKYALSGAKKYQPVIDMVYMSEQVSIQEALESDKWDYVALQANSSEGDMFKWFFASDYASNKDSNGVYYSEYWSTLSEKVSQWAPGAEKLTHMTWGPSDEVAFNRIVGKNLAGLGGEEWDAIRDANYSGYDDANYEKGTAREVYYHTVKDRYEEGNKYFTQKSENIIPSAIAVYLAITKYGFDEFVLNNDGSYVQNAAAMYRDTTCHLAMPYGRVLAGLTWYETLTGHDVTKISYQNAEIPETDMIKLKAAAHEACQTYKNK